MKRAIRGLVLGWVICAGPLFGGIEWQNQRVVLHPPAGAEEAVAEFTFINRGAEPVTVVDVTSGCGCTAAAPEPRVVAPGERGTVRAVYHIGERRGRQSVAVNVTTEEPERRVHELALEVTIKDFVSVAPRLLFWRVGEATQPKRVQLALADGFRLLDVRSADDAFAVTVLARDNANPQLEVVPRDTWAKRNGSAIVRVVAGDQAPIEMRVSLRVL